jgi:hypothetical protein
MLRDRRLPLYLVKSSLIVGIISWWPALYSVLLTSLDPLWKEVLAQFANAGVYTPTLWQLPILLGPAFLLALFTVIRNNPFRLQGLDDNSLFLRTWFLANFLLIYIPTDYQVHMLNGWQVPIAILATQGLFRYVMPFVADRLKLRVPNLQSPVPYSPSFQRGLAAALILVILPTNLYLLAWRFVDLSRHNYPFYLYRDEVTALAWLENNAKPDDGVLSSITVGQYVPAITGLHAFLAHWAQTVDYYNKEVMVKAFFANDTTDQQREAILRQYSVDYIFYGPAERSLGSYNPETASFLQIVYTSSRVKIYQIRAE